MNQQTKAALRSISTVLVIIVAILAFLISGIRLFGFQVYGVLSGSMEPTYAVGSLVYVKAVDPDDLKLRDVITFSVSPKTVVTHRIVEIVPDENNPAMMRYRTKGDANESADASLVGPADIIGRVAFSVPHLGNVASYIQSPPGLYVAIAIGILLIAIVIITDSGDGKSASDAKQKSPAAESPFVAKLKAKLGMSKPQQQEQPLGRGYVPQKTQPVQPVQYQQPQQYQAPQQYQQPVYQQQYPQQVQGYQQHQQYQQYAPPQQYMQPPQQYRPAQPYQPYPQQYEQPQQYQPPQQYAPQQPYQQYQSQGYPQQRTPRSARNYNGQQ